MTEFIDRLRRQRGDPPAKPTKPAASEGESPEWLRRQLGGAARSKAASAEQAREAQRPSSALTFGDPTELSSVLTDRGELSYRELRYPDSHEHGAWALREIDRASRETLELLARDAACRDLDLRRAVYLDIETTGLSGGAGTIAFMVALGTFEEDEFRLWQGFLRSPAEEAALMFEVALRVAEADSMVSFFGKSFDRHRLEDKMKLHGVEPPFDKKPHLDLYWPLQRLYGRQFGDGRLGTMETRLTGVERCDDLPGSFAPEAWFDYLGGRGHRLEDVFRHNRDDVLSLVVLAAHAGRATEGERSDGLPLSGPAATRAAGLGRLFAANREFAEALVWCDRALAEGGVPDECGLRLVRADLLARVGEEERALRELTALSDKTACERVDEEVAASASVTAAKLLEHRFRDPERALAFCERARELALTRLTSRARARVLHDLDRREERLRSKSRPQGAAEPPTS